MSTLDSIANECKDRMKRSVEYLDRELRGIRTGRATTALIDYVKVPYYGNPTDLREIASVSVPEPSQLLVKPFDPAAKNDIVKALESADLGLNPMVEGGTIRINIPPPSNERRKQLVNQVKKMAEEARISVRNERRDAMKQIDALIKDKANGISEDQGKAAKDNVEDITKSHIGQIDAANEKKAEEIESS